LPFALRDEAEVEGAYRLMNNPHVDFHKLAAAHANATRKRAEKTGDVIVVHDTTTLTFEDLEGEKIGFLQTGKPGFLFHVSLVLDATAWRRPLGVIHGETIHRKKRSNRGGKKKPSGTETASWDNRESKRWWRGMEAAGKALADCQSVLHVADREGDSYELMEQLLASEQRFVVRVRVNRRGRADATEAGWSTVKEVVAGCEGKLEREVPLSSRSKKSAPNMNRAHPPRSGRVAKLRFSATRIEIPRPQYLKDPIAKTISLNLVHVTEYDTPAGESPVEWLLYTTEPTATSDQIASVVDTYRARWTIEEFNSCLKTGCAYESREFQSRHALLNMLALSLPVACELLWLRSRARDCPKAPATDVLSLSQIKLLRSLGRRKLSDSATARDALLAVAGLGGHLKNNGEPGWKVLARGMQLLLAYDTAWHEGRRSVGAPNL